MRFHVFDYLLGCLVSFKERLLEDDEWYDQHGGKHVAIMGEEIIDVDTDSVYFRIEYTKNGATYLFLCR